MKKYPTMNFSLLETMIQPLSQDMRQQQRHETQHHSMKSSEADDDRLPPIRSRVVERTDSIVPSKSIPISNIKRTLSEIQLHEDEAMADYRDYCFYARLVNGINSRREGSFNHYHLSADQSIANIVRTRNLPVMDDSFSQTDPHAYSNTDPGVGVKRQSFLHGIECDDDQEEIFILDMWWISSHRQFCP